MSYCSACRRRGPWDGAGDTGGSEECTNKRRKFSEPTTIWIRQIMCIPSFSVTIARAILQHFDGSMRELHDALRIPVPFPDVAISATGRLGKERIAKLQAIFNPPE